MTGARIIVSGIVQGVGFRWFALDLANSCGLVGWVRNRMGGDVEIAVEGHREVIDEFIDSLERGPNFGRVESVEVEWTPAAGKFTRFSVKF